MLSSKNGHFLGDDVLAGESWWGDGQVPGFGSVQADDALSRSFHRLVLALGAVARGGGEQDRGGMVEGLSGKIGGVGGGIGVEGWIGVHRVLVVRVLVR